MSGNLVDYSYDCNCTYLADLAYAVAILSTQTQMKKLAVLEEKKERAV